MEKCEERCGEVRQGMRGGNRRCGGRCGVCGIVCGVSVEGMEIGDGRCGEVLGEVWESVLRYGGGEKRCAGVWRSVGVGVGKC